MLGGEITLTVAGWSESYRKGDVFTTAREYLHFETTGVGGSSVLIGGQVSE